MIPDAIFKLEKFQMNCTIAGFRNDDLLNFCNLSYYERYKKAEEIPDPTSTNTKLKSFKSNFSKNLCLNNQPNSVRMIVRKLRHRVHCLKKELNKLKNVVGFKRPISINLKSV